MDDLNPISDPEMARIIQPYQPFETPKIHLPKELIHEDALVMKVYALLVDIAQGKDGKEVVLPPREEFAQLCGANYKTVIQAELRLQELGWIQIVNFHAPGKKERRRIIVKVIESIITDTNKLFELIESGIVAMGQKEPETALHNIYRVKSDDSFPPQLHALKSVCKNKDVYGTSLSDITDQVLFELSGYASYQEIEIAIREVENFRPSKGAIRNIALAFRERFVFCQNRAGSLKESRKYKISKPQPHTSKLKDQEKITEYQKKAHELGCSIYPDLFHDESVVDHFCKELNHGGSVERGASPQSIRNLYLNVPGIIVPYESEPNQRLVLYSQYHLEKIRNGYWKPVPLNITRKGEVKRCEKTVAVKDGIQEVLKNLSLDKLSS